MDRNPNTSGQLDVTTVIDHAFTLPNTTVLLIKFNYNSLMVDIVCEVRLGKANKQSVLCTYCVPVRFSKHPPF